MLTKTEKYRIGRAILNGATTGGMARAHGISRKTAWVTFRQFCYPRIFQSQYDRAMGKSNKIKELRKEYHITDELLRR